MFAPARAETTDVDSRATREMILSKTEPLEKCIRRRVNQSLAVQADTSRNDQYNTNLTF